MSETIEGIGHPEMIRYDLPRIARICNAGRKDLYVDRFSCGSRRMKAPPIRSGAVLQAVWSRKAMARATTGDRQIVMTVQDSRIAGVARRRSAG